MSWKDILKQETLTSIASEIYNKAKDTPQAYSNGIISVVINEQKTGRINRVGKAQPIAWLGENDIDAKIYRLKDDDQQYIDLLKEVLVDPELNGGEAKLAWWYMKELAPPHWEPKKLHDWTEVDVSGLSPKAEEKLRRDFGLTTRFSDKSKQFQEKLR